MGRRLVSARRYDTRTQKYVSATKLFENFSPSWAMATMPPDSLTNVSNGMPRIIVVIQYMMTTAITGKRYCVIGRAKRSTTTVLSKPHQSDAEATVTFQK